MGSDHIVTVYRGAEPEILVYSAPDGQWQLPMTGAEIIQLAYVVHGAVVFGVGDDITGEFWVRRWTPQSGEVLDLYESTGTDAAWSETAIVGDTLFMTVPQTGGGTCVSALSLNEVSPSDPIPIVCEQADSQVGWLQSSGDTLSYMTQSDDEACPQLFSFSATVREPVRHEITGCASRASVGGGMVVWNESPSADASGSINLFVTELRVMTGETTTDLGESVAGSTEVCDGYVYWLRGRGSGGKTAEIRRWTPGGEVEVVYRSPDDEESGRSYATSGPSCGDDGRVYIQRMGDDYGAGAELLGTESIGWRPALTPASQDATGE